MRLAILLFMSPTYIEKDLIALQHLFPDYAQMKAHIVTVIDSRTRGPTPMMMGKLNEEESNHDASSDEFVDREDGKMYRVEITHGKKVLTKPQHDSSKRNTEQNRQRKTSKIRTRKKKYWKL